MRLVNQYLLRYQLLLRLGKWYHHLPDHLLEEIANKQDLHHQRPQITLRVSGLLDKDVTEIISLFNFLSIISCYAQISMNLSVF